MTSSTHPVRTSRAARALALVLATAFACTASFADKPEWAGKGGKGGKHEQQADRGDQDGGHESRGKGKDKDHGKKGGGERREVRVGGYFGDQQRVVVQNYYGQQFKAGHCPPGLAKKHNGCMPPGQVKKYAVGQPLPAGVVFYPVPTYVVTQLGSPPAGHKYVRVASDILLIAVGSSMVVDAIQDLSRI
jgi:Ni/Co efflux regulator RcnB